MKILLPVDGSEFTKQAVKYVLEHLQTLGAQPELTLLFAYPSLPGRATAYLDKETVAKYHADQVKEAMTSARKLLKTAGVSFKEIAKRGDAAEEIAKTAEKGKFDLVIMGSHGRGMFKGLLLGSVATKVLAACKVPVLLIRK